MSGRVCPYVGLSLPVRQHASRQLLSVPYLDQEKESVNLSLSSLAYEMNERVNERTASQMTHRHKQANERKKDEERMSSIVVGSFVCFPYGYTLAN